VAFESHDSRTPLMRMVWIGTGVLAVLTAYYALLIPSFGWPERTIVLGLAILVCYPLVAMGASRHLTVLVLPERLEFSYNHRLIGSLQYADVEYAGYTAEIMGNSGLRYVPVAAGYLYVATQPGFLCTVDLRRPRPFGVAWMMKAPVKRVLFTLDDPSGFMRELRRRMPGDHS
jgi:hypothetical protein